MPPHFKRAVIYGVGLLGGSLGMAMRRRGLADEIVGLGRARKRLDKANQIGALDAITTDAEEAMAGADALILCLPPRLIRKKWAELAALAQPGIFVTDVGSVKEAIVEEGEKAFGDAALFIGSHPMAGSEKAGVESARGDLFESACCFVTPTDRTPAAALALATQFWRAVGSRVVVVNPKRHDALLALISHLPHLAAVALMQTLYDQGDSTPFFRAVIGNGFRDSTRIAAGQPEVWEQIFSENSQALTASLDVLIARLQKWREMLGERNSEGAIIEALDSAGRNRTHLAPEPAEPSAE